LVSRRGPTHTLSDDSKAEQTDLYSDITSEDTAALYLRLATNVPNGKPFFALCILYDAKYPPMDFMGSPFSVGVLLVHNNTHTYQYIMAYTCIPRTSLIHIIVLTGQSIRNIYTGMGRPASFIKSIILQSVPTVCMILQRNSGREFNVPRISASLTEFACFVVYTYHWTK